MTAFETFPIAAVQAAPVYFDAKASTEKACGLIAEAGARGARLAAFSETWLPGYPYFVWLDLPSDLVPQIRADYLASAITTPGPETDMLRAAARDAGIDVVIGVAERDPNTLGSVYCTLLFISHEGEILGRHRKLRPTDEERTMWAPGDGSGLVVHQRPYARISGLNCWEHNMLLPGYTLIAQGTQVHVATWPGTSTSRHLVLSQAFASQAGAYVLDVGGLLSQEDLPAEYRDHPRPMAGHSHIIEPGGDVIAAGPAEGEMILVVEASTEKILAAKADCDPGAHYSRPDVFRLRVDRTPRTSVVDLYDGTASTAPDGDDDVEAATRS